MRLSLFRSTAFPLLFASLALLLSSPVSAVGTTITNLNSVYSDRPDLQKLFDADGNRRADAKTALPSLEQWAKKYGYKEYPDLLAEYAPAIQLWTINASAPTPVSDGTAFPLSRITASAIQIVDIPSGRVIASHNAKRVWPMASLTKLMTGLVSQEVGLPFDSKLTLTNADEVGGARLRVATGEQYLVRDLFYAMLVGSANNSANAIARATGLPKSQFVARMNARAKALGMTNTTFVDPTGIETGNVSTVEEITALALKTFNDPMIRRATTTSTYKIPTADSIHTIKNTNKLLVDPNNGLYVLGGKTGYLEESGWNLAVKMRDSRNHPVLVVLMDAGSQNDSFNDAALAAKWAWDHHTWK